MKIQSQKKSIILKNIENSNKNDNLSNINAIIYGISIYNQKFDYKYNPTKGYLIDFKTGYGLKKVSDSVASNQIEIEFKTQLFFRLKPKFTFLLQNESMLIYNKSNIYENEMFKIGGFKTLRGFDEKSILANHYSLFSWELRYLFEKNSNVYIFTDFCYFAKELKPIIKKQFAQSLGVGINFYTKTGIFSMSYALGRKTNNIFIIQNAKIHFGFVSFF